MIAAALGSMTAVAQNYTMGNPSDNTNYGYLKHYLPLKQYINYEQYPNFKLGIAVSGYDYLNNDMVKNVVNGYFTEVVTGNEMKMSSVVDNNGNMNFNTVTNFVNAASAAGVAIFGHTLAWHSQQPTGYLNGLIKDLEPIPFTDSDTTAWAVLKSKDFTQDKTLPWKANETDNGFTTSFVNDGLQVHTTRITDNIYDVQYNVLDNISTTVGQTYRVTLNVRGSASGVIHGNFGSWDNATRSLQDIPFTTSWQNVSVTFTSKYANCFLMFQHGDFVGDIWIRNVKVERIVAGRKASRDCIIMQASAKQANAWDNQFWIKLGDFSKGDTYEFRADIRADKDARVTTQIHTDPTNYVSVNALGDINFTTGWKTVTKTGTFSENGQSIAFNLNEFSDANGYYFDNISFKVNGLERVVNGSLDGANISSFAWKHYSDASVLNATITRGYQYVEVPQSRPLSPQVKHDTLVYAMSRWIYGIMNATQGKVKAWDVVNEAIAGFDGNGDGIYDLQHGSSSSTDFFWQDHMGDLEYMRQAVRLARQHYATVMASKGGDDGQLKLFVNDYNLESDWDNNQKLKSLIQWIDSWEADGVTYIDGIGTQMHISCYMDEGTQNSKKNAIASHFSLMAATGKLVRISEMDMGMVDASGNNVPTASMTEAMHQRMADFYEWIIKKYLEIVPPAQQWGICQWCATDSPSNSGWRADTPVGIWNLDWYRKHAYAGFARGLGAPENPTGLVRVPFKPGSEGSQLIYDLSGRYIGTNLESLPAGVYIQNGVKYLKY